MKEEPVVKKSVKKRTIKNKSTAKNECSIKKSAFDYSLIIRPDGTIEIEDSCGNICKPKTRKTLPPIKKVVNTRALTIVEATGSKYIYVDPPGVWILVDRR